MRIFGVNDSDNIPNYACSAKSHKEQEAGMNCGQGLEIFNDHVCIHHHKCVL